MQFSALIYNHSNSFTNNIYGNQKSIVYHPHADIYLNCAYFHNSIDFELFPPVFLHGCVTHRKPKWNILYQ